MKRRTFIKSALGVAAAAAIAPSLTAANAESLHVYVINDGGYTWWWAAPNRKAAREMHIEMNYTDTGEQVHDDITDCGHLPDDEQLTILDTDEGPTVTKPAKQWCDDGEGFLGTTCF